MAERQEKYTPGPWQAEEDGLIDKMVVGGNYDLIIDLTHKDGKRNEADSNLIAAAPEMYETLKKIASMEPGESYDYECDIYTDCGVCYEMIKLAREALKKARGEA